MMKKGIKALKERTTKGEIVVCHTDKSGKFNVMPLETYTKMGLVHTANFAVALQKVVLRHCVCKKQPAFFWTIIEVGNI